MAVRPGSSPAFEAQQLINAATAQLEERLIDAIEGVRTEFKSDISELRTGQESMAKSLAELVQQEQTRIKVQAALEASEEKRRKDGEWTLKRVLAIVGLATTAAGAASWLVQHFAK